MALKTNWGICFGLATLGLYLLAQNHADATEWCYSRGLFLGVRYCFDATVGQLPFPAFYLFWLVLILYWGRKIKTRSVKHGAWKKWQYWSLAVLNFFGALLGLFYWLWAFNYARVPLEDQLGLELQPLDTTVLWQELKQETKTLDSLRACLVGADTNALNHQNFWPDHAEDTVRVAVENWLAKAGFPTLGKVRGRFIYPEGTLFKFGASGVYWPFIGEGNLEAGMHPLRKLPSMAHEMSHGYGFGDEGVCNFIAFIACADHSNPYLAYCAHLDYWETLAEACLQSDPPRYNQQFKPGIPRGIVADEHAIRAQHRKFREFAPELRYQVYDSYLRAQGIESGMLNYDAVLMLVSAWRKARK